MSKDEIDALLNRIAEEKQMAYEEASRLTGKTVEELMEAENNMDPARKQQFDIIYDITLKYGSFGTKMLEKFFEYCKENGHKGVVKPERLEIDAMVIFMYASAAIARELTKEMSRHPDGSEEDGFNSFMNMARDLFIYAAAVDSAMSRAKLLNEMEEDDDVDEGD